MVLIALLIAELIVYSPVEILKKPYIWIDSVTNEAGPKVEMKYQLVAGSYTSDINVVFLAGSKQVSTKPIYIYYDTKYPFAWTTAPAVIGMAGHLDSELAMRGYVTPVKLIDAQEMRELLLDVSNASSRILIVATGAMPDTVLTKEQNLIKPWVENGGILFWISDYFLFYSAEADRPLNWKDPRHPGKEAAEKFSGFKGVIAEYPLPEGSLGGLEASTRSPYAQALNLIYPYLKTPLIVSAVEQLGGKVLGWIGEPADELTCSIGSVPVGNGTVVIFGGAMPFRGPKLEKVVAHDIAQILYSGALEQILIGYRSYHLERGQTVEDEYEFLLNSLEKENSITICAFEFNSQGSFFFKKIIELSHEM